MHDYLQLSVLCLQNDRSFTLTHDSSAYFLCPHHCIFAGKVFFMWSGPKPMIVISKPVLLREALPKIQEFQKPKTNPFIGKLFAGVGNYEGEQWAQHRRMLNPAFHTEKLKVINPNLPSPPPTSNPTAIFELAN